MSNRITSSNIDLTDMTIDSLGLAIKNEKSKSDSIKTEEQKDASMEETILTDNTNSTDNEKLNYRTGHGLNDQSMSYINKQNSTTPSVQFNPISKFDGQVNVE